jgi:hypothetical protein
VQIPLPPTDNLYKFVAISGLILVVTSIIMYSLLRDNTSQALWEAIPSLKAQQERLEAEWASFFKRQKTASTEASREQMQHSDDLDEASEKINQRCAQTNAAYESAAERLRNWSCLLLSGIIGALMMAGGFFLWYRRVQKFQDLILASEAKRPAEN